MIRERLTQLMVHLTDNTVLGELLAPVQQALASVRGAASLGRVLSMQDFIALGVLRHLRGMTTLREQVQTLLHLDPAQAAHVPLPRSTWSDALAAGSRLALLKETLTRLNARPVRRCPIAWPAAWAWVRVRWAPSTALPARERALSPTNAKQGSEDNAKGHALLTFYNLRTGLPRDVFVETRSRHETRLLRDYDRDAQAMTRTKGMLWLVNRAFIDAPFWDAKKAKLASTMITRMKSSLRIDSTEGLPIADDPANAGVVKDLRITLASSPQPWRLITYRTRRGHQMEFLTNDFDLLPGVIAFLYARRWDEEEQYKRAKCRVEIENFSGRTDRSVLQDFYAKIFAMNLTAILVWVAQAIADRLYATRRHPYRVNFANALSKMKHAGARLLLGLGGQELVATLVLAIAANVEAVRPDRSAPRKMKPAKIQGYHPNYKRCR